MASPSASPPTYTIQLDPSKQLPPLAEPTYATLPASLPPAKAHHTHPTFPLGTQDVDDPAKLSIYFVGTVSLSSRPPCRSPPTACDGVDALSRMPS